MDPALSESIRKTNALACLECGRCTGVCPVSRFDRRYSPRSVVTRTVREEALGNGNDLWNCLTCMRCAAVCPANIQYSQLTRILRSEARDAGIEGRCSHSGALELLQRIMTVKDLHQNRLDWVTDDLQVAQEGELLFFSGCGPYFEVFFEDLELNILEGMRSVVKILNNLGITPAVLADERCCGHDLLWNGDGEHFKMLAEHNLKQITASGAKKVIFSCAECMSTFQQLYPQFGFTLGFEMLHFSQFLAERIERGEVKLAPSRFKTTYQDPCRLGRHMGIYDPPRRILNGAGDSFQEMRQNRGSALCCGVSGWMNCGQTSRAIQVERLRQARETGAQVLAVACPKCQIHLACSLKDTTVRERYAIEIRDLATLALERLECQEGEKD